MVRSLKYAANPQQQLLLAAVATLAAAVVALAAHIAGHSTRATQLQQQLVPPADGPSYTREGRSYGRRSSNTLLLRKHRITWLQQHSTIRSSSTDSSRNDSTNSNSNSSRSSTADMRFFSAARGSEGHEVRDIARVRQQHRSGDFQQIQPIFAVLLLSSKDVRRSQRLLLLLGQSEIVAFHSAALVTAILVAAAVQPATSGLSDSVCSTLLIVPLPLPLTTALP
ncbi:hypothetical protein Emed_006777 [Eimeria media]